jgi:hypothetical protein
VGDGAEGPEPPTEIRRALVGLGLGARLRRTVQDPPEAPPTTTRAELEAYFADNLFPWATSQSTLIYAMASQGAQLLGYGRGVVAIEAAMADLRFVKMARAVPLPEEMRKDPEIADVYYASLDEALEPRKGRGRDAALIGLSEFARLGIAKSERLQTARALIAKTFAGHRMAALDTLLLPAAPRCEEASAAATVAARVNAAHVGAALASQTLSRVEIDCLLEAGLPTFLQHSLETSSSAADQLRLAKGEFALGVAYFTADFFQAAEAALSRALDTEQSNSASGALDPGERTEARFLRALSVALMAGPRSPLDLFRYGSKFPRPLGDLTLLDAVATAKTPVAPLAQFDASYLRELVPEEGAPSFWKQLAQGYERAAAGLRGAEQQEARARARAARETATTLAKQLGSP